jgi:hypothetical protein
VRRTKIASELAVGDFGAEAAEAQLGGRFSNLLSIADSIAAHDEARAAQLARTTAAGGDDLVRPLAAAVATQQPDQVPAPVEGSAIDVRVHLASLVHERVYLLGHAENAAGDRRDTEQQAVAAAADANAGDTGAVIASVFGPDAGTSVSQHLRDENAAFVRAAGGGDRQQAADDVNRLRAELDGLLSGANVLLPKGLLSAEYRNVDQPLLSAADAFQAHDWSDAYARVHEAARQSQHVADSLAASIIDRFPGRFGISPSAGRVPRAGRRR